MDEIIKEPVLMTLDILGRSVSFNPIMIIMTWIVMAILVIMGYFATKRLKNVPGKMQNFFEMIYTFMNDISVNTLGKKDGRSHLPFFMTIFIFVLLANWIALIPNIFHFLGSILAVLHKALGGNAVVLHVHSLFNIELIPPKSVWYTFLFNIPNFEEPTKFVNTDLALAILVFFAVHIYGIKNKGIIKYLRSYVDDPFPMKGPLILLFFLNPFFYLNLISQVANVVSHSFRLFGNIFGGAMIIVIVSALLKSVLIPVGLFAFFGLFAGLVQAFVFAMLAVTYVAQQK